jgi:hypothetical protein
VVSNELRTLPILTCPTDTDKMRRTATNWTTLRGDLHISYFLGTNSPVVAKPQVILFGDRNVTGGGGGLDATWNIFMGSSIDAAWDRNLHALKGNLGAADGSALELGTGVNPVVFSKPRGIL